VDSCAAAVLTVPSAAISNLGRNKPLMVFTRLWKSPLVLPMFRAHPSAFIPGIQRIARPTTHARLELPVWMK
jgi:hypothetical protein